MLDIKWIRENGQEFDNLLIKRGIEPLSEEVLALDEEKRQLTTLVQQFQYSKNKKSKLLGTLRTRSGKEFEETKRDIQHINEKLSELELKLNSNNRLQQILENLPNLPAEEVPYGVDETGNKLIRGTGEVQQKTLAKQHFEL